jgi:2-hydroxy-6-oxonona-2,4-dienedioate hydrolase
VLNFHRYGSGPTLVLQHGFVGGGGYFAPLAARLARFFDVICPDLPGFAGSAGQRAEMTVPGLSRSLISLLDALGVERFCLLGHSLGGAVALQTALDHAERIDKLVLYGTGSTGRLPNRFETVEDTLERIQSDGIQATAERIAATWFVEGARAPLYEFCVTAAGKPDQAAAMAVLESLQEWEVTGRLDELDMPVLVLCGDHDRSYGLEDTLAMMRRIAGSQFCVIPNCAHAAHLESPGVFADVLINFLLQGAFQRDSALEKTS